MLNKKFYVICDNIRSLENIGSIFRTSDGLMIDKIFLCGICGTPPSPKISKTALGAEENIPWEYHFWAWKLVENAISLEKFKPQFPLALVVGNEIKGVSESILKRADKIVYIPMFGKKESFNVSVAFAIAAYKINTYRLNIK